MSICRFSSDCDLYIYVNEIFDDGDIYECCMCKLTPDQDTVRLKGEIAIEAHIREHIQTGHKVPGWITYGVAIESAVIRVSQSEREHLQSP